MLPYLKKYSLQYFFGTCLLVLVNLLAAYIPQLIKQSVDKLQIFAQKLSFVDIASELRHEILISIALITVMSIVMSLVRIASRQVLFGIGRNVEFDLKKNIFNHLVAMPPSFFAKRRTGDLISIISNDVQSIRSLAGFAMLNIVNTVIAFAIILPMMFHLHFQLTIFFLITIPLVIIFIILLSYRIKKFQEVVQVQLGEISNFIEQNLSGIHIIKAFAQEDSEIKRFKGYNDKLKDVNIKLVAYRSLIGPVMRVVASIGFILLLYIGGKSVIAGNFTPGDFTAYGLYIQRLIWPIATLGWLITLVYRAQVSEKRINSILHEKPSIFDHANAVDKNTFDREIKLNLLNTEIPKGINLAIVGTIGSGKTILAQKLMHLKEMHDGEISIDGIDIKQIKLNSLRTLINMVPQENFLFATSIRENIAYAKDLSETEIINLAKLVNIYDEVMKFPAGFDSVVGERGITLSGGQRQRLSIARALALDPEILILDDALSSLDDRNAREILGNILKLRKNKTTIFITHKISITNKFERIWVMDKGQIVEQGSYEKLAECEKSLFQDLLKKSEGEEK